MKIEREMGDNMNYEEESVPRWKSDSKRKGSKSMPYSY
jgi:hypothetical protein